MDAFGLIFLVFFVAAAIAVVALWRRLGVAQVAMAEVRLDNARLTERLTNATADAARLQARTEAAESARDANQRQATEAQARIEERTRAFEDLVQRLSAVEEEKTTLTRQLGELREAHGRWASAAEGATQRAAKHEEESRALADERARLLDEKTALAATVSELTAKLDAERASAGEKIALLTEAKEQLGTQFKLLATDILEEKRKAFTEHSQTTLDTLLKPLGTSMDEFRKRIDQIHSEESQQRASLSKEVRLTLELNQTLAKGAEELTRALKGSTKVQGNWGERVLESVLEASGLRRGQEYETQVSGRHEDGTRGQPDVVINLPGARHLVVDSKVSLSAYQEHVNAESELEREATLKRHVDSMRAHVKGLSAKSYQDLYGIRTLDFVLMFVPIEPAFMLAAQADPTLFEDAWNKNIILVSPSTLLFVLRTVASLWRQEQQSQNAQEIARKGGELYDKLAGFLTEFDKMGRNIEIAHNSFAEVRSKLATGRGSVIKKAQGLRELGVKPTKQLPAALVEQAEEEDEPTPALPTALCSPNLEIQS